MVLWRELFEPEVKSSRQTMLRALRRERTAYGLFPGENGDLLARVAELELAQTVGYTVATETGAVTTNDINIPESREVLLERVETLEAALAGHVASHEQAVLIQRDTADAVTVVDSPGLSPMPTALAMRLETGTLGSVIYNASVISLLVMNDASGKRVALYTVLVRQSQPTQAEWTCRRRFSDFAWLEERLHPITDRLPRKTMFRSFKKDFLERRRETLNAWIKQVPKLIVSDPVIHFFDGAVKAGLDSRGVTDRVAESIIPK
jgi:hypothetical protein